MLFAIGKEIHLFSTAYIWIGLLLFVVSSSRIDCSTVVQHSPLVSIAQTIRWNKLFCNISSTPALRCVALHCFAVESSVSSTCGTNSFRRLPWTNAMCTGIGQWWNMNFFVSYHHSLMFVRNCVLLILASLSSMHLELIFSRDYCHFTAFNPIHSSPDRKEWEKEITTTENQCVDHLQPERSLRTNIEGNRNWLNWNSSWASWCCC